MTTKYLKLLASRYHNIHEVTTEIINLSAMLNLPKGTEHFVSDIHGEDESFGHVLRNASGVIKDYIEEIFGSALMESEMRSLATLIYYPAEKLAHARKNNEISDEWYKIQLFRILKICKRTTDKYTRAEVVQALPKNNPILEELIFEDSNKHKQNYYNQIISQIIKLKCADDFIIRLANVIHRLSINHLHVLGDIFDRGSGASHVLDILQNYHSLDIQWGNHDIAWMGAAAGSDALICNVIRVTAKYANLETIEEHYGINLAPLAIFAMEQYAGDDCKRFLPDRKGKTEKELDIIAKMHKAITIIQFKKEAELITRHPEYRMDNRILLDKLDIESGYFPTLYADPLELTPEEDDVMEKLRYSFMHNAKLQQHVKFLFNRGSMYKIYNSNLLFHGGIPLTENGELKAVNLFGEPLAGRALLDKFEEEARRGFFGELDSKKRQNGQDIMWYLWCGADSPLYGKDVMTTFERYFFDSPETIHETESPYYTKRDNAEICGMILREFGLHESGARIINGHTPVKTGENPIKANGRLIVIDGGFTKAYQSVTGIAGYTLIYNSQGLLLSAHTPFVS
ncbi:MAG: fructose-1,6-bisphosphatase, partial [Defluviitaleaceae bacterium]|nr:fructose-1,6-bisphosphatase [Defluviitaleaceae bacterium]